MVQGLVSAMDSVWYILLLLMLLVYIFAVLGVILFAGNDPANFNDVATAMMVSKCILQWRDNPFLFVVLPFAHASLSSHLLCLFEDAFPGVHVYKLGSHCPRRRSRL